MQWPLPLHRSPLSDTDGIIQRSDSNLLTSSVDATCWFASVCYYIYALRKCFGFLCMRCSGSFTLKSSAVLWMECCVYILLVLGDRRNFQCIQGIKAVSCMYSSRFLSLNVLHMQCRGWSLMSAGKMWLVTLCSRCAELISDVVVCPALKDDAVEKYMDRVVLAWYMLDHVVYRHSSLLQPGHCCILHVGCFSVSRESFDGCLVNQEGSLQKHLQLSIFRLH